MAPAMIVELCLANIIIVAVMWKNARYAAASSYRVSIVLSTVMRAMRGMITKWLVPVPKCHAPILAVRHSCLEALEADATGISGPPRNITSIMINISGIRILQASTTVEHGADFLHIS